PILHRRARLESSSGAAPRPWQFRVPPESAARFLLRSASVTPRWCGVFHHRVRRLSIGDGLDAAALGSGRRSVQCRAVGMGGCRTLGRMKFLALAGAATLIIVGCDAG